MRPRARSKWTSYDGVAYAGFFREGIRMHPRTFRFVKMALLASLLVKTAPTWAEDTLTKCAASTSEDMLTVVKDTAGLKAKSQIVGLRGAVKFVCVDKENLDRGRDTKEVEAIIEKEAWAAVPRVFGRDYLDSHPLN